MRTITGLASIALALALPTLAAAQDPTGEWLVKDKIAAIKIDTCDGKVWGIVSWEKDPGGVDANNPDPGKRKRPTLGMPVILGMKATEKNKWEGEIYNSQDGKTYAATISVRRPDVLRVEGCILGFLCGGEDWTRRPAEARPASADAKPAPGGAAAATKQRGNAPAPRAGAPAALSDVCSRLAQVSGGAHQGRLK